MSRFSGPLTVTENPDGRTWTVHERFEYWSDLLHQRIIIPKGFVTDGASVPRIFWSVIPPMGKYGEAAVLHDFLYRWQKFSRRDSDDTLLEAMWVLNCADWQWFCIWTAVRLFGKWAWKKDSQNPLTAPELFTNR